MAVGVAQGVRRFTGDLQCVRERELPLPVQPTPQGFALHERHHVVQPAGGLTGVVEREDMRVVETGSGFDLAEEPLRAERSRELGP